VKSSFAKSQCECKENNSKHVNNCFYWQKNIGRQKALDEICFSVIVGFFCSLILDILAAET